MLAEVAVVIIGAFTAIPAVLDGDFVAFALVGLGRDKIFVKPVLDRLYA